MRGATPSHKQEIKKRPSAHKSFCNRSIAATGAMVLVLTRQRCGQRKWVSRQMLHVSRWKTIAVVLTCLASLLFSLPNFFSRATV
jgi:hypothetical protein